MTPNGNDKPNEEISEKKNDSSDKDESKEKDRLALPAFILSVVGVVITSIVSCTNIQISSLKNDTDRKISRANLVLSNIDHLNSGDEKKRAMAISAIAMALEKEERDTVLGDIEKIGTPEVRQSVEEVRQRIQQAELQRQANFNAWAGVWTHTFTGQGDYTGGMTLRVNSDGEVDGEYDANGKSVTGTIKGRLSEDAATLTGTWDNKKQQGSFYFVIGRDESEQNNPKLIFRGDYALFGNILSKDKQVRWTGVRPVQQ